MKQLIKNKKGQSLVEAIVALGALTVAFMAILTLLNRSFALSNVVSESLIGTNLAAEGVEIVKSIVDANLAKAADDFGATLNEGSFEADYQSLNLTNPFTSTPLRLNPVTGFYDYDVSGKPTPFIRSIEIDKFFDAGGVNTHIKVTSRVTWTEKGGGDGEVVMEDYFFDWKAKP
jgi:hypothetical protein